MQAQTTCYIDFGDGKVGSVDVDFVFGSATKGSQADATEALVAEKEQFAEGRRALVGVEINPLLPESACDPDSTLAGFYSISKCLMLNILAN